MILSEFAKPLVAKNHFIKASFGGFQGSGKTFTATNFVIGVYKDLKLKKPILILDNEKGGRFLINLSSLLQASSKSFNDLTKANLMWPSPISPYPVPAAHLVLGMERWAKAT